MSDRSRNPQRSPDGAALSPDELAAQEASVLPNRQVMSLLDPNALGGSLLSSPTGTTTDPTGTTGATDATQPAGDAATTAGDTASQGTTLAGHALPDTSDLAGQTYQPTATSTATS